jgi:hypothetical protein
MHQIDIRALAPGDVEYFDAMLSLFSAALEDPDACDRARPPAIALYSKLGIREDVPHFDIACGAADGGTPG